MSGIQAMLLSASGLVPGNSGIITAGTSYTLPTSCGYKVKILAIAGGGGGGGGSGRTSFSGYYTGGGGGGTGGNAYAEVSVIPGQSISIDQIGGGGSAGVARDGIYSSGSDGGAGSMTIVSVNGVSVVEAVGGNISSPAVVSPTGTGGSAGYAFKGTALLTPRTGVTAPSGTTYGGNGAAGYNINTTVGATTILTFGSSGTTYAEGVTNTYNTAGTGYGAGGSGGSCAQSDIYVPSYNIGGVAGLAGAVFIWWGY